MDQNKSGKELNFEREKNQKEQNKFIPMIWLDIGFRCP
jgi:hypothetical protein